MKDPSSHVARWSLKPQQYDMTAVYCSGQGHRNANSLSRDRRLCEAICVDPMFPTKSVGVVVFKTINLSEKQRKNAASLPVIDYLLGLQVGITAGIRRAVMFSLVESVLCRRNFERTSRD